MLDRDWDDYDAALFDLDGVLTPTAEVHMRAWQALFTDFLTTPRRSGGPYLDSDYFDHIDGKPRYDGVRDFLASRGITLADGDPGDPPTAETVCGLGNRKNDFFAAVLADDGVEPYPGSAALLDHLADARAQLAVVSSSRNAPAVLEAAGLGPASEVVVDGNVAAERGLPGKPAPDTFVTRPQQLGVAGGACGRVRGRRLRRRGRARPAASGWWSASTAAWGPTGSGTRGPTLSSPTSADLTDPAAR